MWAQQALKQGDTARLKHPDPAGLMWRRYLYDDLEGTAVYAGFSRDAEVVGLFLMSLDGKTPLTARRLAKLSIESMRRQWRDLWADGYAGLGHLLSTADDARTQAEGALILGRVKAVRNRHPGRAGHPAAYYADVAVRYTRLAVAVDHPVKELAASYGISVVATRNLVYTARRKGFLTPAVAGKGGGVATPKAVAALEALEAQGED